MSETEEIIWLYLRPLFLQDKIERLAIRHRELLERVDRQTEELRKLHEENAKLSQSYFELIAKEARVANRISRIKQHIKYL